MNAHTRRKVHQHRSRERGHDDVVSRCRQSHAEQKTCERRNKDQEENVAHRKHFHETGDLLTEPHGDAPDNDACRGRGKSHTGHVIGTGGKRINQGLKAGPKCRQQGRAAHTCHGDRLQEHDDAQNEDGAKDTEFSRVLQENQFVKEHEKGEQEVHTLFHLDPKTRQFVFRQPLKTEFAGLDMRNPNETHVGGKRRNGSGFGHFHVRHVDVFGNNKGRRSHHGGRELSVNGRGHFNGRRLGSRISDALHERNREGSGRHDVSNGRTGNHAGKSRSGNGGFCRAASVLSESGNGNTRKERSAAGPVKHRSEKHEEEHDRCRHMQRHTVNTLGVHRNLRDKAREAYPLKGKQIRQIRSEEHVGNK